MIVVVDIGGSHVTSARYEPASDTLATDFAISNAIGHRCTKQLDPGGPANQILATIAATIGAQTPTDADRIGISIPGPFDYSTGIAWFEGVGKFDALYGVDVAANLAAALAVDRDRLVFLNDADAAGLGEYHLGHGKNQTRFAMLTLGTGIGSAFIVAGKPLHHGPGIPPQGRADRLYYEGRRIEEHFSTRAICAAYRAASGTDTDVRSIFDAARHGSTVAFDVIDESTRRLGDVMAPHFKTFRAGRVAIGGAIANSWDVLGPLIDTYLARPAGVPIGPAQLGSAAGLVGAAYHAIDHDE